MGKNTETHSHTVCIVRVLEIVLNRKPPSNSSGQGSGITGSVRANGDGGHEDTTHELEDETEAA